MSETTNLRLFKHDNPSTNTNQFDVDTTLNENWDKIDGFAEKVNDKVIGMEDEIEEKGQQISNLEQELKLENERLRQDLNALPAVSENGENITLNGTAEARFKELGISGNSWQETRSGRNKFNGRIELGSLSSAIINYENNARVRGIDLIKVTPNSSIKVFWSSGVFDEFMLFQASNEVTSINTSPSWQANGSTVQLSAETNFIRLVFRNSKDDTSQKNINDITRIMVTDIDIDTYEKYGVTPSTKFPSKIRNCGDNVNLIGIKNNTVQTLGLNIKVENEEITINGTSTSSGRVQIGDLLKDIKLDGRQYIFSLYEEGSKSKNMDIDLYNAEKTEKVITCNTMNFPHQFSNIAKTAHSLSMYIAAQTVFTNYKLKLKLEEGTIATPYSEYGKSNANFTICNKNLFKLSESVDIATFFRPNHGNASLSDEMIKITTTEYNNSNLVKGVFVRVVDIENMIPLDFSKEIIFSFEIKQDADSTIPFKLSNSYNDKTINLTENYQKISISVLKNSDNDAITLYTNADNRSFYIRNIQLEYETEASDYEEHKEQSFTFPLTEGQVLHLNDYLAEDGVHHTRKSIVLDGVSNGLKVKTVVKHTNDIYYCTVSISKTSVNYSQIYNSHFKNNGTGVNRNNCYITGNGGVLVLVLEDQTITTVEQANAWLAQQKANGTPVTVNYILAVEEIEEYNEEQQAVYNEIKKTAKSYKGTTNIFSTDEVSPIFDVEALRDLNVLFSEVK